MEKIKFGSDLPLISSSPVRVSLDIGEQSSNSPLSQKKKKSVHLHCQNQIRLMFDLKLKFFFFLIVNLDSPPPRFLKLIAVKDGHLNVVKL